MIHKIPKEYLSFFAFLHDLIVVIVAWVFAFSLRFNFEIPESFYRSVVISLPCVALIELVSFVRFGLYQGIWRFASLPDLKRIVRSVMFSGLIIAFFTLLSQQLFIIPRSVLILNPLLLIVFMGGSRFIYRSWKERKMFNSSFSQGKSVLVVGVDEPAINLMKELSQGNEYNVVALVDPYSKLIGKRLLHTQVEGGLSDIPFLAEKYRCQHCIIALPTANHVLKRKIVDIASSIEEMEVLTLPSFSDLMNGKVTLSTIRKVDVEDLLGRDPVDLDFQGISQLIHNKTILVSGAAGSIGSELCRQILQLSPAKLICLDISEYSLYQLEQEFASRNSATEIIYLVTDVKNGLRMESIFTLHKPEVVFHAAAYKHVPMMENNNVIEALANNVIGTYTLATVAQKMEVVKFVLISTDKAVNPTNVMGASKRLAELVCQGLQMDNGTQFVTVRFGNVLGSSGSVIPKFKEQIQKGGPVTVTHPEITRYFMSIPEAAQLVVQAGHMGAGGEIFVLDMGAPVKIVDLAKDMIKLSGYHLNEIKIEYTGLRPGEKLYEELLADDENTVPTPHAKLRTAMARTVDYAWVQSMLSWLETCKSKSEPLIKQELKQWVLEYSPTPVETDEVSTMMTVSSNTIH